MNNPREVLERVAKAVQEEMQGTWSYDSIVQTVLQELMLEFGYDQQAIDLEAFFRTVLAITELEL